MSDSISGLGTINTVFWTVPSATKDITASYISAAKFFEFAGTSTDVARIIDGVGVAVEESFVFENREKQFSFLSFFNERKGSMYKFWSPVWNNTFVLSQKAFANQNTINIKKCAFTQCYQGYERIWIKLNDGSKIVRQIVGSQENTDSETLTLNANLDRDIDVGDVKYFGRFILCRFGESDVEIEYTTSDYATCTIKLYELVQEYGDNASEANQFAELYDFIFPETTYRYTSFYKDVLYNNYVYTAVPMNRNNIESNINIFLNNKIEIVSRATHALKTYVYNSTLLKVEAVIVRLDIITGAAKTIFRGMGNGVALKDDYISISLTPLSSVFEYRIPRLIYQPFCNNILFDLRCGLYKSAYAVSATVVVNADGSLKSDAFATKANGWFIGGFVSYGSEFRLITNHVTDTIWLQVGFNDDLNNKGVNAYPGCDGSPSTCRDKFNNLSNYLGFPYIPSKNPVVWGLK